MRAPAPALVSLPGEDTVFSADAVPDTFDARDLVYQPRLTQLPQVMDNRDDAKSFLVLHQQGAACTGHAVAAVINTILARTITSTTGTENPSAAGTEQLCRRASPYMLYRLGRRYDDFGGEIEAGSSLRGVFKGWFYHGVSYEEDWPSLRMDPEPDVEDPAFRDKCRDLPLGAYYRVNPFRLDDMQSAISELHAIAVSLAIHDGWIQPLTVESNGQILRVIYRDSNAQPMGGHSVALVGYNDVGFLVQNSWGTQWGKGGFATLPYEDWLDCAYDAWVARPGVRRTPSSGDRLYSRAPAGDVFEIRSRTDVNRLDLHVVNIDLDGRLTTRGRFVSSAAQIERIFANVECAHNAWLEQQPGLTRRLVLSVGSALVDKTETYETAQRQLNWWLNNQLYPLYFSWQDEPTQGLLSQLAEALKDRLMTAAHGFAMREQSDRLVENVARSRFSWMWDALKQSANLAFGELQDVKQFEWPPRSGITQDLMAQMPGGTLMLRRLADYIAKYGPANVEVHLVCQGDGAIFLAPLLQSVLKQNGTIKSLSMLAPAMQVTEFVRDIVPQVGPAQSIERLTLFGLTDERELGDVCEAGGLITYRKSLLYLISRALERPGRGEGLEVPLLGMRRFFDRPVRSDQSTTLSDILVSTGGRAIFAPSFAPDHLRSDAIRHADFNNDWMTMTSVLMCILDTTDVQSRNSYTPNAPLARRNDSSDAAQNLRG